MLKGQKAKKSLGQHFLINKNIIEKIVLEADIKSSDTIIEIGPGLGALTIKLAEKGGEIIAIEKDRRFIPLLKKTFKPFKNVEIIEGDALKFFPKIKNYKIVANIPYYITSPLLKHYLLDPFIKMEYAAPKLLLLLVQKEVAEKICAKEGKLNVLALNVQTFAKAKIIGIVKAGNFSPKPLVDSAIIKIAVYNKPLVRGDLKKYFDCIHAGFQSKRKNLLNALSHNLKKDKNEIGKILKDAKIDSTRRAETLTIKEWANLTNEMLNL
ncbi:ribosomal RNA small subunit methyltransferase A [Candidatus Peregrinibacteria bacterium]|nr:ribosomal RNA small subunit methyltransferase A [Candidatus Peregrinibacteria bacterium]